MRVSDYFSDTFLTLSEHMLVGFGSCYSIFSFTCSVLSNNVQNVFLLYINWHVCILSKSCLIVRHFLIDIKDKLMISSVNDIFIRFQKERNEIYGGKDCRKLLTSLVVI
jgi:hypothetical protein